MNDLPWMKFWTARWNAETAPLSLAARGALIELRRRLHEQDAPEETFGLAVLVRILRADRGEVESVLAELDGAGALHVTRLGDAVTVVCPHMKREHAERAGTRERVRRHRIKQRIQTCGGLEQHARNTIGNGDVTPERLDEERRECSSGGAAPHDDDTWISEIQERHPGIDVRAELERAGRKYPRGFDRGFFERDWLPRCTPKVGTIAAKQDESKRTLDSIAYGAEPADYPAWFIRRFGDGVDFKPWSELELAYRQEFARNTLAKAS